MRPGPVAAMTEGSTEASGLGPVRPLRQSGPAAAGLGLTGTTVNPRVRVTTLCLSRCTWSEWLETRTHPIDAPDHDSNAIVVLRVSFLLGLSLTVGSDNQVPSSPFPRAVLLAT